MKRKKRYSIFKHMDFLLLDFLCIEGTFFLACQIRQEAFRSLFSRYFFMSMVAGAAFVVIVMFWNIYSGILRRNFWDEMRSVFALVAGIFVSLTMYCFIMKSTEEYSRAVLLTFITLALPIIYLVRLIRKEFARKKIRKKDSETLLFIREEDMDEKISYFTQNAESGVIATGIVTYEKSCLKEISGIPIVGCKEDLKSYVDTHDVDCVYIHVQGAEVEDYIEFLVRRKIVVYRALRNLGKSSFRYMVQDMNGYQTMCIREKELSLGLVISKRLQDIIVSLAAIILSLPVTIATAIAIKLEDGGPIFYVSKRMGQYGKEFDIYKFRSMKLNADKLEDILSPEELEKYYKEYKLDNDPRITRVGGFIRKYSIDELPQFLNILKGDMAVIGPRPILRKELDDYYRETEDLLLSLKPGLTGYWQAYGRNKVTYESGERQKMELYYIEHFSWKMDMKILCRTMKVVLTAEGAK